jgi:hypothetical protein
MLQCPKVRTEFPPAIREPKVNEKAELQTNRGEVILIPLKYVSHDGQDLLAVRRYLPDSARNPEPLRERKSD